MRVLSFAPCRPGLVNARQILWREVRNRDLPPDLDAEAWLATEVATRSPGAVAMMTSRDVATWSEARHGAAHAIATVGLGNAERVGLRRVLTPADLPDYGTINVAVVLDAALADRAIIEALTIAAEARTAAIIESRLMISTGIATGTGTDCIAIAAIPGHDPYAGLHTAIGEAIGRAVYQTVLQGARDWIRAQATPTN